MRDWLCIVVSYVLATGCSARTIDAGSNDGGRSPDTGMPGTASLADGVWTGYAENYMFPSGSDVITMTLQTSGSVVTGTMKFGNGKPPAAATNPDVDYPPAYGEDDSGCTGGYPIPFAGEGFVYTIEMGTFDGSRLRAGVAMAELWTGWCALQTSYATGSGCGYSCLPTINSGESQVGSGKCICFGRNPATDVMVPVDCGKNLLCSTGACLCDAKGCTVSAMPDTVFDLAISGSRADGSTTGQFGDHNVHFTHQ